jgi:hypothetical protein
MLSAKFCISTMTVSSNFTEVWELGGVSWKSDECEKCVDFSTCIKGGKIKVKMPVFWDVLSCSLVEVY